MISKIRVSQASEIIPSAWGLTVQLGFHVKFFPTGKHLLSTVDSSLEGFRFIATLSWPGCFCLQLDTE